MVRSTALRRRILEQNNGKSHIMMAFPDLGWNDGGWKNREKNLARRTVTRNGSFSIEREGEQQPSTVPIIHRIVRYSLSVCVYRGRFLLKKYNKHLI